MKLSIITINFNNSKGLEGTISSITSQTFRDFEYIIIDGKSTDNSVEVIKKYEGKIDFWVSEPDSGIYNAMNKGILKAKGEYILFINSGDFLYNDTVLSDVFTYNLNTDLIYGDLHRRLPDSKTDIIHMPEKLSLFYIYRQTLAHPATFIKRDLFLKFGLYREDLKIASDWAFFFKIITFANVSRTHVPIVITSFAMDGISYINEGLAQQEREKVILDSFSPELLEILRYYPVFYDFYDKKIFRSIRLAKHSISRLFSSQSWKNLIYRKRINPIISRINKNVRSQEKDFLSIPIIIINYNRLSDLKQLISFLQKRNHKKIVIVDNNSSYPPLLDYYEQIKNDVTIERMDKNYGHLVFWKNAELFNKYANGYYVVTDSDILPNEKLPDDYLNQLRIILDNNKKVSKVGFALRIDDIPDEYPLKEKVIQWESQFWNKEVKENLYIADIDTTFAIYPPFYRYKHITDFYKGVRVAGDFTAKHCGWYIDKNNLSDEDIYYKKTANSSNNW